MLEEHDCGRRFGRDAKAITVLALVLVAFIYGFVHLDWVRWTYMGAMGVVALLVLVVWLNSKR